MRKLAVDFAPPNATPRVVAYAGVAVLWSVAGWLLWQAMQAQQAFRSAARERDGLRAELATLQARQTQASVVKREPSYFRDAQQLAQMAQLDSASVLRSIEAVRVPGVRVAALEFSAVDATVRLDLEVSMPDAMLRYLAELNAGEPEQRWTIVRSQIATQSGSSTASLLKRLKQ